MQQTNQTIYSTSPRRVFYQLLLDQHHLTHQQDIELLLKLVSLSTPDGTISLTTSKRKQLCTELSIQPANLSKYIKRLKDSTLLTGGAGEYKLTHYLPTDQSITLTIERM